MNADAATTGHLRWCFYAPGRRTLDVLGGSTRNSGGAEAQIAHLAASLAQLGHQVALIHGIGDGSNPLMQPQVIRGVTCLDAAPAWRRPGSIPTFWRVLNRLRPNVLYARLPNDFLWMLGLHARWRSDARFIYALAHDLHCEPWRAFSYKPWLHGPLYALGLASAHVIAAQHQHQSEGLRRGLRSRIVQVPNLVRQVAEMPDTKDPARFDAIWVAQIRPEKRLEHFLDLADSLPNHKFAVVGGYDPTLSPGQRLQLEARLRSSTNVTYFGALDAAKVAALMAASRALVNTSEAEGFPNTMLEAWSLGVPVISLEVDPGLVIRARQLGLVSGNAEALRRDVLTLSRPEAGRDFAERGLAYVKSNHSLDAVHKALLVALGMSDAQVTGR